MKKILIILLSYIFLVLVAAETQAKELNKDVTYKKEKEVNNTIKTANLINPIDNVIGNLKNSEDIDFYKVVLPYGGSFYAGTFLGNDPQKNKEFFNEYEIKLYDSKGRELSNSIYDLYYDGKDKSYSYLQLIEESLKKGTYYISIQAKDKSNLITSQNYLLYTDIEYIPDFTVRSITNNVNSPAKLGKKITFKTNTKKEGLHYRYTINGIVVRGYSNKNTFTWKPTKKGTYTIKVEVRDPKVKSVLVTKTIKYKIRK